jgi:hypothetical protein
MKRILVLLFLIYLNNSSIGYCQLLSKPSLTVEDFEIALTNADHLRKILKKHNFEYFTGGAIKFNAPGTITNPLIPDLRAIRSEDWELKNQKDQIILEVNMFEWEPDHGPHPEVIKTIRFMISRNSFYSYKMDEFLENIKNKYPNKSVRYFRNIELYQSYGEPLIVFANDSKIEVRTETVITSYGPFYTVCFDLVK